MKKTFTFLWVLCAFMVFGSQKAMAGTETYEFQVFCQGLTANITISQSSGNVWGSAQAFEDIDGFSFNGRFAGQGSWLMQRKNGLYSNNGGDRDFAIMGLKSGDKIVITYDQGAFNDPSHPNEPAFLKYATTNATVDGTAVSSGQEVNTGEEITMSADGILGFRIKRYAHIQKIVIETAAEETVTTPKIAVTGANGIERTVVITPGHSDAEGDCMTLYTIDGSDPTESSTAEVSTGDDPIELTIDETCTVKAVTMGVTGVFSEVASLEVSAGDYLPLDLALSVSMNDGVATFTATSNNSNLYGAPTADITFELDGQTVGDGNSFTPTKDGTMHVTASADGYGDTEISVPVFAKYEVRWQSSDYSTPGIAGDFEGWIMSGETGRWANWAEGEYIYYVLEEATAQNITLEGDEEGKVGVRMRGVLSFVDGFGISRNISGTETIGNIASKGQGRIAIFRIYNGYNKSDSFYEVGYVNVDGSNWLQHQLQGGHCLVQTIAYMGVEQQAGAATAIKNVNADTENGAIYNLQGQRVSQPERGIFVKNGKKVIVK